jgi:hypothetical protein
MNTLSKPCPVCKEETRSVRGHKINPDDGVTLWCPNVNCGMADWGHGKDENAAYEIFKQKCEKGDK